MQASFNFLSRGNYYRYVTGKIKISVVNAAHDYAIIKRISSVVSFYVDIVYIIDALIQILNAILESDPERLYSIILSTLTITPHSASNKTGIDDTIEFIYN